jgi:5-methylcytosine-specific restriction endonuclease McrA
LSGEKNPNWKGGKRAIRQMEMGKADYAKWRKAVYTRDNYTCQRCMTRGGKIEAHHIKPFSTHFELRFDVDNGMTLCKACHKKEHNGNFREDTKKHA